MQKFIVVVDDVAKTLSVANNLQTLGMQITSVLPNGIINGKFQQDKVKELYLVEGVIDVELDENIEV